MRYLEPVTVPAPPRKDNRKLKVDLRGSALVAWAPDRTSLVTDWATHRDAPASSGDPFVTKRGQPRFGTLVGMTGLMWVKSPIAALSHIAS